MTLDETREEVISGIDYAAYRETDFSPHDAGKKRWFGPQNTTSQAGPFANLVRGQRAVLIETRRTASRIADALATGGAMLWQLAAALRSYS